MYATGLIGIIFLYFVTKRTTAFPSDLQDCSQSSEEDIKYPTIMDQMGKNLNKLPLGNFQVTSINFSYNNITDLPAYVFYTNRYKNLQKIELGHNRISKISLEAFRELRQVTTVDLSSNNISYLEPNTVRHNPNLQKLDMSFNKISFDPEKPFLRSQSLKTLVLSNNQITHVFDITFARMPSLQILLLESNTLYYLSPNCFAHLRHIQYVNLANTEVHRVKHSMFRVVPRLVDLTGTILAEKFDPPLRKVRNTQLVKLMDIEEYILGNDEDT